MALGLYFGAQAAGAIALVMVGKRLAHGHLPSQFNRRHLLAALPAVVGGRAHAQHLTELAHGHLASALGNVLGWPKMTKAFLKCQALAGQAQRLDLERLIIFTPFVGRRPACFACHDRRNIRPSSIRHL
jgi:hypothetical protein